MKRVSLWVALLALCTLNLLAPPTQAAPNERCFPETGYCISGAIRSYWERGGGLAVFGYPISPVQQETVEGTWTGPVQWFERDRLEDHANESKGVLAGRLGARFLEVNRRPWQRGEGDNRYPPNSDCRTFFRETGYQVCGFFRSYWERNGGLERFGAPISEPVFEQIGNRTYEVQYFERRRLEYHPEQHGTPYEVLLGLLGRDIYQLTLPVCMPLGDTALNHAAVHYQGSLGCPSDLRYTRIVYQSFEGGEMIWVPETADTPAKIYAIFSQSQSGTQGWAQFVDTYREGEPVGGSDVPPTGRDAPQRGFGKIWWNTPVLRQRLGWAYSIEQEAQATLLVYPQPDRLLMKRSTGTLDVFLPSGEYTQAPFVP